MTWLPIANTNPQYMDEDGNPYVGAVLKAYTAGTATNILMATDNTGGTTASSMALNSQGYIEVSGTQVIPHVEESYKLSLYPTQAAADADSSAIWTIDNLTAPINTEVVDLEITVDKAANYTAVLADKRKTINVTAAATISLGDASTMGTDYRLTIKNSHTAAITVDLDTALDTLDGTANGSISLEAGQAGTVTTTSGADGYKVISAYLPSDSDVTFNSVTVVDLAVTGDITYDSIAQPKVKILDIGDWDMDTSPTKNVAHGLTLADIRSIVVVIRSDAAWGGELYELTNGTGTDNTSQGYWTVEATNVELVRLGGGDWDGTSAFDDTSYNRGWITITYF